MNRLNLRWPTTVLRRSILFTYQSTNLSLCTFFYTNLKRTRSRPTINVFGSTYNTKVKVKVKVNLSLSPPCRHREGLEVNLHLFLISALDWGEWSASCPAAWILEMNPCTNWIGGWLGPRARLSGFEEQISRSKNISPIFIRENESW